MSDGGKSGEPERVIFHVDLDAFFVEVERQSDASLIGKPVVIGGLGPRGVVATASYEAREFGVHSAQAMAVARRLCPQAIFMRGSHDLYREVSKTFMAVLSNYSPIVVPVSVDEAYLDMTGTERLYGAPTDAARAIKKQVHDELGLPASIGIGSSKLVAKVSTEHAKPDGICQVRQDEAEAFFAPLPVRNLPGIGPKAGEALAKLNISTLGELANAEDGPLRRALGPNNAGHVKRRAKGIDNAPLRERAKAKSDPTPAGPQTLLRPLPGDVVGRFGRYSDPVLGIAMMRNGVELAARARERVRSPAEGEIVYVGELAGYDHVVVIDHGAEYRSLVGRLLDVSVTVGDTVERGATLGRPAAKRADDELGRTVYYELRHAERPMDPRPFFSRR